MTRRMVGSAVLVLALVAGLPSSAPAASAAGVVTWPLPGTPSSPPVTTYLHMVSARGDSVGAGRTWTFVPAEADITVTAEGGNVDIHVEGDTWWDVVLRPTAPQSAVTEGRHEGTARAVVSGDGRGCGEQHVRGWYEVDDVAYAGGDLVRLAVRFAQWCADADEARGLHGEVRWDAQDRVPPAATPVGPAPAGFWRPPAGLVPVGTERNHLVMASDPGDFVGRGQTHAYTGFDAQHFQGALTMVHPDLSWRLSMRASNRATALEAGFYPNLLDAPFSNPTRGGFAMSGAGRGCNRSSTDVVIDEIDTRGGTYRDLALRFEQHCELGSAALRGQWVWQAPVLDGTPGAPSGLTLATPTGVLTWQAPSPGASPITGYRIVVYRDGTASGEDITVAPTATRATVPFSSDRRHSYKVYAVNAVGAGPRSGMSPADGYPPLELGPFGSTQDFVGHQYQTLVGRNPTVTEMQSAVDRIEGRQVTPGAFVAGLRTQGISATRAPIIRLYAASFLRPVDAAGLAYWVDRREGGLSLRSVAQAFAASPELRQRYGSLTNAQFVDRVYRNVLGRTPDAAGLAYWTGRLDSGTSRGEVLLLFSEAPENRARRAQVVDVTLLTIGMLERAPTVDEVNVGGVVEGLALHNLTRAEYLLTFFG